MRRRSAALIACALAAALPAPPATAAATGINVLVVTGSGTGSIGRSFSMSGTATGAGVHGVPRTYNCTFSGFGNGTQGWFGGTCGPLRIPNCSFVAAEVGLVVLCLEPSRTVAVTGIVATVPNGVLPTTSYTFTAVLSGTWDA